MNEKTKQGLILLASIVGLFIAYKVINNLLQTTGLLKTEAEKTTDKKVGETVSEVSKEIKESAKKLTAKGGTMTAAQKKLAYTPTYSNSFYLQLADALFESFNHVGTNTSIVKNTMAQMKKRLDVLKLIEAYGVRQTLVFGLKDGAPSNLIGHLVSENAVDAANEGLKVNRVFYTF
jgi:hypothetical protein